MIRVAVLVSVFWGLTACTDAADGMSYEYIADEIVSNRINSQDEINVTASEIFPFEWERACFGYGPRVEIRFFGASSDAEVVVSFDEERYFIREEYVPRSPAGECFPREQEFTVERVSVRYESMLLFSLTDMGVEI